MTQNLPQYSPDAHALAERRNLAIRFLDALAGAPGGFHSFQTFDDLEIDGKPRKFGDLARLCHGAFSGCCAALESCNAAGAGVFVTVNETDFHGRHVKNVVGLRAVFVDKDDGPIDENRINPTCPPSIRVRTVQGEHAYWLLARGAPLHEWKALQQTLTAHFSSDPNVNDLPRVMRIPGFYHNKRVPTLLDQVWYGEGVGGVDGRRYTFDEIAAAYPKVRLVVSLPSLPGPAVSLSDRASSPVAVLKGGRNNHLTSLGGSLRSRAMNFDQILAALLAENAGFPEPLDPNEVEIIARSVSRYEPAIDPSLNASLVQYAAELSAQRASAALAAPPPGLYSPGSTVWMSLLLTDQKGNIRSCTSNAVIVLDNHPAWQETLGVNVRAAELVFYQQPPILEAKGPFPRSFRDEDYTRVGVWLTTAQKLGDVNVRNACVAVGSKKSFDPVVDYLADVQPRWDGVERLGSLLAGYCGAHGASAEYLSIAGTKWMIQCVARAREPGCQGDATLILEGGQGKGKTSFFRILAGLWLGEHPPREMGQKMQEFIRGPWIVEFGELSSFKRSEVEEIKSFLTLRTDRYRPAYGLTVGEWPRRCSFGGSTNGDSYLVDVENRRYWPVSCGEFDLEALARDRDQLWAEAAQRYDEDEQWHLTPEERPIFAAEQLKRVFDDAIVEEIQIALSKGVRRDFLAFSGTAGGGEWGIVPNAPSVSVLEITKHVFASREHDPRLQTRIVAALRRLGWTREKVTGRWIRPL